jgi:hypothetical protein
MKPKNSTIESLSVVVPDNPFSPPNLKHVHHCLCALDIEKLMDWWPGLPAKPHRDPAKIKSIQRSLDWKRVAQIAAYLLQTELVDAPEALDEVFGPIYSPKKNEPGREWPPSIKGTIKPQRSSFPSFSNVLIHVNGASVVAKKGLPDAAELQLDPHSKEFKLTVIDGQHRINGGYFALMLLRKRPGMAKTPWKIPAEVFVELDPPSSVEHQAQIFIDVNLYQKKVDRSLVADLFPSATASIRDPDDLKFRAQDVGRKLMLETGPLVGMIQIPGIRYGVKGVVALATLNAAIERALPALDQSDITNLEAQVRFLAQVLDCWLTASGRDDAGATELSTQNVVYQGRVLVSILDLVPAILWKLKRKKIALVSAKAVETLTEWLEETIKRAGMMDAKGKRFISRAQFSELRFLGSGGVGRFRNRLWAAAFSADGITDLGDEAIAEKADRARDKVNRFLSGHED